MRQYYLTPYNLSRNLLVVPGVRPAEELALEHCAMLHVLDQDAIMDFLLADAAVGLGKEEVLNIKLCHML